MGYFRCVSCGLGCESLVLLGAGDCPFCGDDVVFDLRRRAPLGSARRVVEAAPPWRRLLRLLRGESG